MYINTLTVLFAGAPFVGESSGTIGIPEVVIKFLFPTLEVTTHEQEALAREEDVVPTVEAEVSISKGGGGHREFGT